MKFSKSLNQIISHMFDSLGQTQHSINTCLSAKYLFSQHVITECFNDVKKNKIDWKVAIVNMQ